MNKIYKALLAKENDHRKRMPSVSSIHQLLSDLNIEHSFSDSINVVEYRSKGKRYVNSRHDGKQGKRLVINVPDAAFEQVGTHCIDLDNSDSYYSFNTHKYAQEILAIISHFHPDITAQESDVSEDE